MERTAPMAEHAIEQQKPRKRAAVKTDAKSVVAKKVAKKAVANTEEERGARIVVLTDDPRRSVVIVPGCHIDSMRHKENAYFFEDGNALVGMIVEGGTVEYHPGDRTYVVRLSNGRHSAE
jgi:hypothetical protein